MYTCLVYISKLSPNFFFKKNHPKTQSVDYQTKRPPPLVSGGGFLQIKKKRKCPRPRANTGNLHMKRVCETGVTCAFLAAAQRYRRAAFPKKPNENNLTPKV